MVHVWVAGKTVWSLVTRWPYLSTLEIRSLYIKRCINSAVYFTLLLLRAGNVRWKSMPTCTISVTEIGSFVELVETYNSQDKTNDQWTR